MMRRMIGALLSMTCLGFASQLSIPNQSAGPNASVSVPVIFSPQSGSVSAVQFDLHYDTSAMNIIVIVGDAARNARKSVYYIDVAPGHRRFLVVGTNQNSIPAGTLINLFLNLNPSSTGAYPLTFSNTSAADPNGQPVTTTTSDGVVTVEGPSGAPLEPQGVLNGASLLSGSVSPGEIITLMGNGIGVPGVTSMLFDSTPAPLLYVGQNQINAVVPYEVNDQGVTQMQVSIAGSVIVGFPLPVAASTPAIFTLDSSGTGQGAILNQDLTLNSSSNPAQRGSIAVIYATGAGQTNPPGVDGQIAGVVPPLPILPVTVSIGGINCPVLYAGGAPGLISGVLQINCQIAESVTPGDAVPVSVTVGNAPSPPGVTVAVQ